MTFSIVDCRFTRLLLFMLVAIGTRSTHRTLNARATRSLNICIVEDVFMSTYIKAITNS